jgi:hypothetical protein
MYIDYDGDTILEYASELREFIEKNPCKECVNDARTLLSIMDSPVTTDVTVVFCTTCEHREEEHATSDT